MRENEPVLLVLSVCDGEIILEKGEILCEKCHYGWLWVRHTFLAWGIILRSWRADPTFISIRICRRLIVFLAGFAQPQGVHVIP